MNDMPAIDSSVLEKLFNLPENSIKEVTTSLDGETLTIKIYAVLPTAADSVTLSFVNKDHYIDNLILNNQI